MADIQNPGSPKLTALQNLSKQLPVANSRVAQGQQAARQMQVQQAVAAAPQGTNTAQSAQSTGAAVAQNAGKQFIQNAQQGLSQNAQVGQLGLQEQQQQAQGQVQSAQQGVQQQEMDNVQRLAALDSRAKQEIYDAQMQFQKDESGRTLFNERQLADYARAKSRDDNQFKNYAQAADQASTRRLQAMETAYKNISEDLNQRYAVAKQQKDFETMKQVAQIKSDAEARMAKERAKRSNTQAVFTTAGTIGGAVVGGVAGGPAGAAAGASVGGALGSYAGSQQ